MSGSKQETASPTGKATRFAGWLPHIGLAAAAAALIGASCCALPLALASLGLAGAWIANLGVFVVYRPYITTVALIIVLIGWTIAVRRPAPARTFAILGIATAVTLTAVLVAQYEPEINRYLLALRRN
jgi:mercuric ion transport protein